MRHPSRNRVDPRHGPASPLSAQPAQFFDLRRLALALALLPAAAPVLAQGITSILPAGVSSATPSAISADGSVVAGTASNGPDDQMGFRWTRQGGAQDLGNLGGSQVDFSALSANGAVVVGSASLPGDPDFPEYHAFRWVSGVMTDLGTLGGSESRAYGVSANGAVVVGTARTSGGGQRAFRWTSGTGMADLGTLVGGSWSTASAVSADGAVVVGASDKAGFITSAFRWTSGTGMEDISVSIAGLRGSSARFVSTDGAVVAGNLTTSGWDNHAFRWTRDTGMVDLGTLPGDITSTPSGMSADGAVIVGNSTGFVGSAAHAFRWTSGTGMTNLGTLGGNSRANGVSADGLVVVGTSRDGASADRAFRWTSGTGMQSVENWLRAAGVSVPADITSEASATNGDGSVVIGRLGSGEGFIARVTPESSNPENPGGSGLITLTELGNSLSSSTQGGAMALTSGNLFVNGAHGQPLMRRVAAGQRTFWLAGDWGEDDHGRRSGDVGLAEVGAGKNFGPVQVNAALGYTRARQALVQHGRAQMDGTYLHGEALVPLTDRLWAVLSAYRHWGGTDLRRGYLNAGAQDYSVGSPDVSTWGLRARLEWDRLWQLGGAGLSPYADLTHDRARMDAYTERRGGFPARFDARTEKATELRLGLNAIKPVSDHLSLLGVLEAAHRFERHGAATRGQVIGLFGFDLDGQRNQRNWLRAGAGLEGKLGGGMASLMLNVTSRGQAPNAWLAAGWRMAF